MAKVIITPPASVKKPLARCDGSLDFKESPICTIPNPNKIIPFAALTGYEEKLKEERKLQETILKIKKKYGKNSVLKGMNLSKELQQESVMNKKGGHKK